MEAADRKMRRVLVVEDDRDTLRMIVSLLRDEPYRLLWATNARDALRLARLYKPDVILLSWMLPEMTGDQFADLLSLFPSTAEIPLVLLGLEPWLFGARHRTRAAQVVNQTYICEELAPRVRDALGIPLSSDTTSQELARIRDRSLWWAGEEETDWRAAYRGRLSLSFSH